MLESAVMDIEVEALRRLAGSTAARRKEVARVLGVNEQSIYQIVKGVPLESGQPRRVGRQLKQKLYRHYPDWLSFTAPPSARQVPQPPSLAAALEVLGIELARDMPDDVRQDVADTLAKLAHRRGLKRHQDELQVLLRTPPAKRQANGA